MTRALPLVFALMLLVAAPATPFWGAFFSSLGNAVGSALGLGSGVPLTSGLMPVSVNAAEPVVLAAQERLAELQQINTMAQQTLDHYSGATGTLRDLGNLARFATRTTAWHRSATANTYGTSAAWSSVVNGDVARLGAAAVNAYGQATAPVPNWRTAWRSLPSQWQIDVRREHATLELADAASVRSMAVLGTLRRNTLDRQRVDADLQRAALDPANGSQAVPALLGKVTVGQVRQIHGSEQTNQLLDALLETELASLKQERDRLARSMQMASTYRTMAAAQPLPQWRMP